MLVWKQYEWLDMPSDELPWDRSTETVVMPKSMLREVGDNRPTFDPEYTYYTELKQDWRGHPAGSRVIITPEVVAIEVPKHSERADHA